MVHSGKVRNFCDDAVCPEPVWKTVTVLLAAHRSPARSGTQNPEPKTLKPKNPKPSTLNLKPKP